MADPQQDILRQMNQVSTDSSKGSPAKSLEDIITGAFDRLVSGVSRVAGVSFIAKLGGQNVFAQFESEGFKAPKAFDVYNLNGGSIAELVMGDTGLGLGKINFSNITAPLIEAMQSVGGVDIQAIPIEALGQLTPMHTGGGMGGGGMSLA